MDILIIFIFGLAIGSFLNVVIYRFSENQSLIFPASHCPKCQKAIKFHDNIPLISFFILRGRCRSCQTKISWQYPLVELTTALILVWLYWQTGATLDFFKFAVFAIFLLIIFIYDFKYYLILDRVSVSAMIIAFILNWFTGFTPLNLILAGLVGSGFFALQYFISGGKWIGGGDIRLGAVMGLMLGWPLLLVALFLAYLVGALVGLTLISLGKKKMSSELPFGTFLTPATFITLLFGSQLLNWYLNLINL